MKILNESPLAISINSNLLEERKDVFYYRPEYDEIMQKLKRTKYNIIRLSDLIKEINYGASVKAYSEGEVPFLRIQNLQENYLRLDNLIYAKKSELIYSNYVKEGDFLISRSGTIGIVAIVPKEADNFAFGSFMIRFRLDENKGINPDYISIFLNSIFGKQQITRSRTGGLQGNITISAIKDIKVLIPPRIVQDEVVKIAQDGEAKKRNIVKRAKSIISEISDFIIRELVIKLLKVEDRKVYWVDVTTLQDRRDPFFYHPKYLKLLNTIENSPYEVEALKEISKNIVSGQRPKGGVKYIQEGVPSIGGEHITSEGDFNFENIRYIPKQFHENKKKSWIKPFDILIVKDGATTGKVAIVPKDFPFKECNINEHVFKIEVDYNYNPYYVFSYLFSSLGQKQINRLISGAAQKGITRDAIESIRVISPSIEIQKNIAEEVKRRMKESERLKKEAEEVAKKAKKEVEKMIVGET